MTYSPNQGGGKLLGAAVYDPATQVTKTLGGGLAMTALDTTNLRVVFVAPASGKVKVRLGATLLDKQAGDFLLGVLDGATVKLRRQAIQNTLNAFAAVVVDGVIAGLTPGTTYTWDAAYGIENSGSTLKYGGPNDTTTDNAAGVTFFEIWEVKT